jgi:hypothetical protein
MTWKKSYCLKKKTNLGGDCKKMKLINDWQIRYFVPFKFERIAGNSHS